MKTLVKTLLCLTMASTVLFSCKKKPQMPEQKKGIQLAANAKFGTILTDSAGRTLYYFANDYKGMPTCSGNCEINWPVYYSASTSTDMSLNTAEVGTVTRADGRKQTTYKGYPLYYYKDDMAQNDTKGDAVGGVWFVAKPDYSLMLANAQLTAEGINYTATYAVGDGKTIYLTDSKGRTLYAFAPDKNNTNTYTKGTTQEGIWPVYTSEVLNLPSAIAKTDVAVITVAAINKKQLTYKGWPLYYFVQDANRGDNKGIIIPKERPVGTVWPVLQLNATVAPAP